MTPRRNSTPESTAPASSPASKLVSKLVSQQLAASLRKGLSTLSSQYRDRQRSSKSVGLSLTFAFVVGLGGLWGLFRVHQAHKRLVVGDELAKRTRRYHSLLDQKNKLLAELSHLQDPKRIRVRAERRLRMQMARPEFIEGIRVPKINKQSPAACDENTQAPCAPTQKGKTPQKGQL